MCLIYFFVVFDFFICCKTSPDRHRPAQTIPVQDQYISHNGKYESTPPSQTKFNAHEMPVMSVMPETTGTIEATGMTGTT